MTEEEKKRIIFSKGGECMELFCGDIVNITGIYGVHKAVTRREIVEKAKKVTYSCKIRYHELIFFVSSENQTHFNGVSLYDHVGSVRFLPRGDWMGNYEVWPKKEGYCIVVYFSCEEELPRQAVSLKGMDSLQNKFIKLYNLWDRRGDNYYTDAMSVFYEIIGCIRKRRSEYAGVHRGVRRAYDYLRAHFKERDFDYGALCAQSGLSESYFRAAFRRTYHMTPTEALTELRMHYARDLILTGAAIGETALLCGYENVYYFSNVFKKYFGISPSKFSRTR